MINSDVYTPCKRLWEPRKRQGVQEWCDQHLRLNERVAYQAGRWRTDAFPHQRGIMWLWSHPKVEEVYLQWGTRLGKTVMVPALIAWAADNDPGPAMVACPNMSSGRTFEREKLYPMLEDCRKTAPLLWPSHKRAFPLVDLRFMVSHTVHAGSKTALGEKSVRYLFLSELDKWDRDASTEADSEMLALERVKDWPNRKILKESTPDLEGMSRIAANLAKAETVLRYHVPCPHCGEFQLLEFKQVKWTKDGDHSVPALARETARYECVHCEKAIEDRHRPRMLGRGVWAPKDHKIPVGCQSLVLWGVGGPRRRVGTQLSSFYSPTLSWGEMAEAFLLMQGDQRALQNWRNGWEGLPWRIKTEVPHWATVRDKMAQDVERSIVPDWASWLVAGIDVGKWRCHYLVLAYAPGPKVQLVEGGVVDTGDTEQIRLESVASAVLDRGLTHQQSVKAVNLACFDSGYNTEAVYTVCNRYGLARARAIKGATVGTGARAPWLMSTVQSDPRTGKKYQYGQQVFILDADHWKGAVNAMLLRDPREFGALLMHKDAEEDVVRGLCNVAPVPKKDTRGRSLFEYMVVEEEWGDHFHDACCYAVAAADMLGIRLMPEREPPQPRQPQEPPKGRFNFRRDGRGFGKNRRR